MQESENGRATPEKYVRNDSEHGLSIFVLNHTICVNISRLHMAIVGGVLAPIGLWWFAW
jgi:hypothetical protein